MAGKVDVEKQHKSVRVQAGSYDSVSTIAGVEDRKVFVSKVFSTVGLMLVPPFVMAFLPHADDSILEFFHNNSLSTSLTGMLVFIAVVMLVTCCTDLRNRYPLNIILLVLMSLAISLFMAALSSRYHILAPAITVGVTFLVVLLVGILAKFGPCDITGCGFVLCILGCVVLLFGLVSMVLAFVHPVPVLHTVFSAIATVLFVLYLWFDLQLIMGGRTHELHTDETILASTILFTDIVMIFIHLLSLIGGAVEE